MKVQGAALCKHWKWSWVLGALLAAQPAQAQPLEPSRFEVRVGPLWTAAVGFPSVDANQTGSGGDPFRLFASRSTLGPSVVFEGSLAVRVSRWLQVEALASYGKPRATTRITGDFEGAPDITIAEETVRAVAQGGLVAHLTRWRFGARATPFVTAGGGYLRELHEGQTIVKSGRSYFAGGGLRYSLKARPGSLVQALGLRGDARVVVRTGGIALDGGTHVSPAVGASVFLGF